MTHIISKITLNCLKMVFSVSGRFCPDVMETGRTNKCSKARSKSETSVSQKHL